MLQRSLVAGLVLFFGNPLFAADDSPAGLEFFEAKIRPVLVQHCYECHAADSKPIQGGLRLDTRAAMQKGGDTGSAVVPNSIEESLIVAALKYEDYEMPPSGRLPAEVIRDFETWIKLGAPDPRDGESVTMEAGIDFEQGRQFWSFQPPVKSSLPTVQNVDWPRNAIDHFVLARMEQESLQPVQQADRRTLIRRVSFDLLGLPPTPEEVADFLQDDAPDAYAQLIDRLLASPHYGERWGRHWLDVARYADDQAHTFAVKPNDQAWRYRQWVIESLNADLPYDDFVRLQIAGDLLEDQAGYERYLALGYFGLGAVYYKNSDKAKAEADELDDRIDTLTRGFLGLTVSCARCHDHKFDPIPISDYYSLAGIFNSSPLKTIPLVEADVVAAYDAGQQLIKQSEKRLNERRQEIRELQAESQLGNVREYILAIWQQRVAQAHQQSLSNKQLAEATGLKEAVLARWADFLKKNKSGKHQALAAWHALAEPTAETPRETIPAEVEQAIDSFVATLQAVLHERDGTGTAAPPSKSEPVWTSPLLTRDRPSVPVDLELSGAKELYLVINDAGDGKSCDHADWIEPKLITAAGEVKLTDLKWRFANPGYGNVNINRGVTGAPLRIGDQQYENGLGTHAPCVIAYDLPEGTERFQATVGLDRSGTDQGSGATVIFMLFTSPPPTAVTADSDNGSSLAKDRKLSKEKADLLKDVFGDGGLFRLPDAEFLASLSEEDQAEWKGLQTSLDEARQSAPPMYPAAHAIHDANPQNMPVFLRGNPARKGEVAPRQFLRVLTGEDRQPYQHGSGRRELAEDIASRDNPLTARVMVNRVWQHHFGKGLVGTPSNFGSLGDRPTHPELLDWLAVDFMEHGWSLKHLHRTIMLSATYMLSSEHNVANAEIDADAKFLWKMNRRRLDVEAWRDALLAVSGNLDSTIGGENTPLTGSRRTVYSKVSRHELDELLRLFDFPDANVTSEKRTVTTVPQQQLFVLNSDFMVRQSQTLAKRLQSSAETDSARIEQAFQLLFSRMPNAQERELGQFFLQSAATDADEQKLTPWEQYAQVLLSLNEFMYVD